LWGGQQANVEAGLTAPPHRNLAPLRREKTRFSFDLEAAGTAPTHGGVCFTTIRLNTR